MSPIMIAEIIVYTLADAKIAAFHGADRLEIITTPAEGGLTPSPGLVQMIREQVDVDLRVMIRPHSRSFSYTEDDIQNMERDIATFRAIGVSGFVLGVLKPQGHIDESHLARLLKAADGMPVTFHRAFDETPDLEQAFAVLSRYPQVTHVLTSGGKPSVLEAAGMIHRLHQLGEMNGPTVLPGAGLTPDRLEDFLKETKVHEFHMGSGVRRNGNIMEPIDPDQLARVREIADRFQ
ncbi:copper homeostasis protein [Fontibacillus phaseoli]|uniref:PF03932 family protein CutC n=1 Tax=Fontibacillus phaseoli TaxID=1416533 RepID=A0A369BF58_9BACL|nr:copper homeostasis protein CutC [Fontibacillus phaseoli]RCX19117.1 copper homeostasis protein [Fontibacillus phaseoli]